MLLKWATIKGKISLPIGHIIGHIIFPLRVAPMRTETNIKGIKLRNCQN